MNGCDPTIHNYYALYISIVQGKPAKKALMDMRVINAPEKKRRNSQRDSMARRDAEIVRRYQKGVRVADIVAAMHVSKTTVYKALSAAGGPRKEERCL